MFHLNIQGVNLMLGYDLTPMKDIQVRLGKVNVQLIDSTDNVHTKYVEVLVDIADLRKVLAAPDTRDLWEKELRYQVGINEEMRELFDDVPGITDVFAKRVLATQRFRNAGWRTNRAELDVEMILQ